MVITVCDAAHEELAGGGARRGTDLGRLHWSIPDPARTGQEQAFDRVVTDLTDRVARIAPAIRPAHPPASGGLDAG
jgi:ArsR family transcriptional regulator, arsenate/arsenite/antimonite-responsive transcriptional repressor / arsenate reductase (thioredoxin)